MYPPIQFCEMELVIERNHMWKQTVFLLVHYFRFEAKNQMFIVCVEINVFFFKQMHSLVKLCIDTFRKSIMNRGQYASSNVFGMADWNSIPFTASFVFDGVVQAAYYSRYNGDRNKIHEHWTMNVGHVVSVNSVFRYLSFVFRGFLLKHFSPNFMFTEFQVVSHFF